MRKTIVVYQNFQQDFLFNYTFWGKWKSDDFEMEIFFGNLLFFADYHNDFSYTNNRNNKKWKSKITKTKTHQYLTQK